MQVIRTTEGEIVPEQLAARRELLHQSAQDRVKQYIIDRGYGPGDLLPPEAELARQLGISRPSLREAMRALQTIGAVEARHGVGTFVGHFSFDSFTNGLAFLINVQRQDGHGSDRNLYELVAIRELIESAVVERLAGTYSEADIAALYELTDVMQRRSAEGELFADEDWRFHEILHRRSGNQLMLKMLESFWTVSERVRQEKPSAESLQTTARHHRALVDAIAAGDGAAAGRAMTTHFWGVLQWFDGRDADDGLLGIEEPQP